MTLLAIRLCAVALAASVAVSSQANAQCAAMLQYYVNYSKQTTGNILYPVYVTVSKHYAANPPPYPGWNPPPKSTPDPVFFEFGRISASAAPPPNVLGGLGLSIQTSNSNFAPNPTYTASLAIDATGKVTYQEYINDKPVGGMPPTVFTGACINGLVMGYAGSQAWVITFSPGPPLTNPG